MNNKRPFAPKFIDKLDRFLLLNKPGVWSARTHLVLYYGAVFLLILSILAFIMPDDPRTDSQSPAWVGLVSLLSFIGLVVYIIYLLRFNVFKRFGIDNASNRFITFLLTYIAIGSFVFFPFVQPIVETVRASAKYTDDEINRDLNEMNLGIAQLEYDSVSHVWSRDTALVVENYTDNNHPVRDRDWEDREMVPAIDTLVIVSHSPKIIVQKKELADKIRQADSVIQLSDSVYIFLECPSYKLLSPYFARTFPDTNQYSSTDIYYKVIKDYQAPERERLKQKLQVIMDKYTVEREDYNYYELSTYESRVRKRYSITEVGESMRNIADRMHRFDWEEMPLFFRIFFYVTLCLSLLLFSFRHSTPKSFFFALLAAVVLFVLTTLINAFAAGSGVLWLPWVLFYFAVFFVITLYAFQTKSRSLLTGIAINLFFWMLPFIPLAAVGAYYESIEKSHYNYDYSQMHRYLVMAEWAGMILFLVLLVTYVHRLYRNWYASAEE